MRIINATAQRKQLFALSASGYYRWDVSDFETSANWLHEEDSPTFIDDGRGSKLPNGEQGEIIVSGPAVSKVIWIIQKTANLLRIWRSQPGNIGTMTDEGLLLYDGRMDFKSSLTGYRIEAEDVSQNLNKSNYIISAVAVPRYNKDKVINLLAYVILKERDVKKNNLSAEIDITKPLRRLENIMMSYMMPSKFLYRDSYK